MNESQFDSARELFNQALEQPPLERGMFLTAACGHDTPMRFEIERLLAAYERAGSFLEPPASGSHQEAETESESPPIGAIIGNYTLTRLIGIGGMGAVYEAEQERPRRVVAIKLMRAGVASSGALRRFEYEAQLLARLRHAGIAQVYEAGMHRTGNGQATPYFAMEFIPVALPVTEYAAKHKLHTRQKLELFIRVCEAVHHGHQRGVIHRDLKPSNILVDAAGHPKVIDFGVARATDADVAASTMQTAAGQLIGTLQYMSPEQCLAKPDDIDTRSDVYSLGVVLYELMCGRLPYEVSRVNIFEATRVVREQPPTKPSSTDRALRGDPETIVLKALEKDRHRRYESAADLAEDIRRYLSHEPIAAQPADALYRFRKFARRNRALVTAGSIATAALLIATGVSIAFALSEAAQRRVAVVAKTDAELLSDRARAVTALVTKALISSAPHLGGDQHFRVTDAMDQAIAQLDAGDLDDQPETAAALRLTICDILTGNGRAEPALRLAEQALEAYQKLHSGDHPDIARSLHDIGACLESLGNSAEALKRFEAALEMRRRLFRGDHPDVAQSLNGAAAALRSLGRFEEALSGFESALEMNQRLYKGDHADVALLLNNRASCLNPLGRPFEALTAYEAALEMRRRLFKGDHPSVAESVNNVGVTLAKLSRLQEALERFSAALDMHRRLYDGDHPNLVAGLLAVANCFLDLGLPAEALPYYRAAVESCQRLYDDDHPQVAAAMTDEATCLTYLNRAADALPSYEAALEMYRRLYKADHSDTAICLQRRASCQQALGHLEEALTGHIAAREMLQRIHTGDHPEVANALNEEGTCLFGLGRHSQALNSLQAALEMRKRVVSGDDYQVAASLSNIARCQRSVGRIEESLPFYQASLEMMQRLMPIGHPDTLHPQLGLAAAFVSLGRYGDAEPLLLDAAEWCERSEECGRTHARSVLACLTQLYDAWHVAEPSQGYEIEAAEWRSKLQVWQAGTQPARSPTPATSIGE
jgi:tetratricopeptide (TPR) repeat protein